VVLVRGIAVVAVVVLRTSESMEPLKRQSPKRTRSDDGDDVDSWSSSRLRIVGGTHEFDFCVDEDIPPVD
jgi:hypothetical protein